MADEVEAGRVKIGFEADFSDVHRAFDDMRTRLQQLSQQAEQAGGNARAFSGLTASASRAGEGLRSLGGVLTGTAAAVTQAGASMVGMSSETATAMSAVQRSLGDASQQWQQHQGLVFTATAAITAAALAMATAVVGAVSSMTIGLSHGAEELENMSVRTGITVKDLSRMQFAAKVVGVNFGALTMAARGLSMQLVEARDGSSEAAKSFEQMGINIYDGEHRLKSMGMILTEIRQHFSGMTDVSQRNAEGLKTLKRAWMELAPLLSLNDRQWQELMATADRLGVTLDEGLARKLLILDNSLDKLSGAWQGFKNALAGQVAPILADLVQRMVAWYEANKKTIDLQLGEWVKGLVQFFANLAQGIAWAVVTLAQLAPTFQDVLNAMAATANIAQVVVRALQYIYQTGVLVGKSTELAFLRMELGLEGILAMLLKIPGGLVSGFGIMASMVGGIITTVLGASINKIIDLLAGAANGMLTLVIKAASALPDVLGGERLAKAAASMRETVMGAAEEAKGGVIGAMGVVDASLAGFQKTMDKTGASITSALTPNVLQSRMADARLEVARLNIGLADTQKQIQELGKPLPKITAPQLNFKVPTLTSPFIDAAPAKDAAEGTERVLMETEKARIAVNNFAAAWKQANLEYQRSVGISDAIIKSYEEVRQASVQTEAAIATGSRQRQELAIREAELLKQMDPGTAARERAKITVQAAQDEITALEAKIASERQAITERQAFLRVQLDSNKLTAEQFTAATEEYQQLNLKRATSEQTTTQQLLALRDKLTTAIQQGNLAILTSDEQLAQRSLAARASIASSELKILQASYADIADIRAARLREIQANLDRELNVEGLTQDEITAKHRAAQADRMAVAQQFPTFWEKQLQDMANSNTFALGQITNSFTSATAQWIVTGEGFKNFWQQLQITLVQAFINGLIQMGVQYLLSLAARQTMDQEAAGQAITQHAILENAKTAVSAEADGLRLIASVLASKAAGAAMIASVAAFGAVALGVMGSLVIAIAGVFAAIGAALAATVVAAEFAPAFEVAAGAVIAGGTKGLIAAGTMMGEAISAATASLASPMAHGGIMKGPTLALMAEAGAPEAAIPLNDRGAAFMASMLGMGAKTGQPVEQTIYVQLDGRTISKAVANDLPSMLRLRGLPA